MAAEFAPAVASGAAVAAGVADLSTTIDLFFQGRSLKNLDLASKSDPYLVVELKGSSGQFSQVHRSETVMNDLNPRFPGALRLPYLFEELQTLRFTVMDYDASNADDLIGVAEASVASIVAAPGSQLCLKLEKDGRFRGSLVVVMEEANEPAGSAAAVDAATSEEEVRALPVSELDLLDPLTIAFSGRHLDKKDLLGKSDPYIKIERMLEGGAVVEVWKNEHILKTLNPDWPEARISLAALCNKDLDRPLLVSVWDWDHYSADDLIGVTQTSARQLIAMGSPGAEVTELPLIHEGKQAKKGARYSNSGVLTVRSVRPQPSEVAERTEEIKNERVAAMRKRLQQAEMLRLRGQAPFRLLQFIRGGLEIQMTIAIDYTGSNGSLQNVDQSGHTKNQYQQAIEQVGSVLAPYDSDGNIAVFGFGGCVNGGSTDHCFPLPPCTAEDPEVPGVDGVLRLYAESRSSISLSGPTNFENILRAAREQAEAGAAQHKYTVLLILTDGVITDMRQTLMEIVRGSHAPLSVVIVGVGGANFDSMEQLDSDEQMLRDRDGNECSRDIVQFVPFREHCHTPTELAKVTLAELPWQIVEYMQQHGEEPRPARAGDAEAQAQAAAAAEGGLPVPPS